MLEGLLTVTAPYVGLAAAWSRLLLVALLVVGCGGTTASAPPTASVAAVTPSPTKTPGAPLISSLPPVDAFECELAIDTANHFLNLLLGPLPEAIEDPQAMDELVDTTVGVAESQLDAEPPTHPTFVRWRQILEDIDASRLPHLTGDDTPFVEAVGEGALYAETLKAACS